MVPDYNYNQIYRSQFFVSALIEILFSYKQMLKSAKTIKMKTGGQNELIIFVSSSNLLTRQKQELRV